MQFGFESDVAGIDFTLPADMPMTTHVLASTPRNSSFIVNVGCTKWVQKTWVGNVYPANTKEKDFLKTYADEFNAIEFGPTFYHTYTAEEIERNWTSQVRHSPHFKFCPRFPTAITHTRRLKDADEHTARFFDSLSGFGSHLGPILIQLGEPFAPKLFPDLKGYIERLPTEFPMFLEVRHKDWFSNEQEREKLFHLLRENNIGAAISDTPGRRDVVHMQLTTPHAFIRFVGNNGDATEKSRLDAWVERIKEWRKQGLNTLSFFMHQHDEMYAPTSCAYFIDRLNAELGLEVKAPELLNR